MPAQGLAASDGPSDENQGAAGAGRNSAAGGPGGGGGGMPSAADMVARIMEQYDSDSDGAISADEAASLDERSKRMFESADGDGDGSYSKAELTVAAAKLVARIKAAMQGGGAGGPRGGGGGGF